jgi:hypothetical protein
MAAANLGGTDRATQSFAESPPLAARAAKTGFRPTIVCSFEEYWLQFQLAGWVFGIWLVFFKFLAFLTWEGGLRFAYFTLLPTASFVTVHKVDFESMGTIKHC